MLAYFLVFLVPYATIQADSECCSSILLTSVEPLPLEAYQTRLGFYAFVGYQNSRPVYMQQQGDFPWVDKNASNCRQRFDRLICEDYLVYYNEDKKSWVGNFTLISLSSLNSGDEKTCLKGEAEISFSFGEKKEHTGIFSAKCAKIEDVCCQEVVITSPHLETESPGLQTKSCLGNYKAYGMVNGRYIYSKADRSEVVLINPNNFWAASCGLGADKGMVYSGENSVCPEQIQEVWKRTLNRSEPVWKEGNFFSEPIFQSVEDPDLKVMCSSGTI